MQQAAMLQRPPAPPLRLPVTAQLPPQPWSTKPRVVVEITRGLNDDVRSPQGGRFYTRRRCSPWRWTWGTSGEGL